MLGIKKVAWVAATVAAGLLSFTPLPAGAQALRLGLTDQTARGAAVQPVEWRGGAPARAYRGPARAPARAYGPRMGRPAYGRPGYGRPAYGRPVYGRPGYRGPNYAHVRPGYRPGPGWNRPGWRPGPGPVGPGWGRPGWRPPPRAGGPGRWYPGWGWYRPGWGWGYYNNSGAWIALGVASGLALGAAAAANSAPVYDDAVAYCMQRYRSYNPSTGTFTGYDGRQHPCP